MQGQGSASGNVRVKFYQVVRTNMDSSQLIPADRPGPTVARWQINAGTDELILEIFQEGPIESSLLEAIVLSVVLLRSGRSLGDSPGEISSTNPIYYSHPFQFC
jgi:hypothetical protein